MYGSTGTRLGPIEKAQKAAQHQVIPIRRRRAIGDGEHLDAIGAHVLGNLVGTPTAVGIHGHQLAFKVGPSAACAHAFGLALYDCQMRAGADMQPQAVKSSRRGVKLNARCLRDVVKRVGGMQG